MEMFPTFTLTKAATHHVGLPLTIAHSAPCPNLSDHNCTGLDLPRTTYTYIDQSIYIDLDLPRLTYTHLCQPTIVIRPSDHSTQYAEPNPSEA